MKTNFKINTNAVLLDGVGTVIAVVNCGAGHGNISNEIEAIIREHYKHSGVQILNDSGNPLFLRECEATEFSVVFTDEEGGEDMREEFKIVEAKTFYTDKANIQTIRSLFFELSLDEQAQFIDWVSQRVF